MGGLSSAEEDKERRDGSTADQMQLNCETKIFLRPTRPPSLARSLEEPISHHLHVGHLFPLEPRCPSPPPRPALL